MCVHQVCVQRGLCKEDGALISFSFFHLGQNVLVLDDVFIGGQQNVEFPTTELRHEPPAQGGGALQRGDTEGKVSVYKSDKMQSECLKISLFCTL